MSINDISEKEFNEIFDIPKPYVKCNKCGSDIWLDDPQRVLDCSYIPIDEFEKKLQEKQRCPLVPVLRIWRGNPARFFNHYVTVLCSRPCRAGEQRFDLNNVFWCK